MAAEPAYMCRLLAQWNWRSSGSRSDRNKRLTGAADGRDVSLLPLPSGGYNSKASQEESP